MSILSQILSWVILPIMAIGGLFTPIQRDYSQDLLELKEQLEEQYALSQKLGTQLNDIPVPVALFETSLQASISSSATSMTLVSATDKDGTTLASSTYAFILDEGTADEEFVIGGCTGTACQGLLRGVSVLTGSSTVSSLAKAHRRGASVKITDAPILLRLFRLLNGSDYLPNKLKYLSAPTFQDDNEIITKKYADDLVNSGAADASLTVKGIFETADPYEIGSSTPAGDGDTSAALALTTDYSSSTPTGDAWDTSATTSRQVVVVTTREGTIWPLFVATSSKHTYRWGGLATFGQEDNGFQGFGIGTSSPGTANWLAVDGNVLFTGTTTTGSLIATTTSVRIGGISYEFPGLEGASGTQLTTNGAGQLAWQAASGVSASLPFFFPDAPGNATTSIELQMNTNTTANFYAFTLPASMTVASTTFMVSAVGTAGTYDIGIYSGDGDTLHGQGTTNSINDTGLWSMNFSSSMTLDPGTYYWAIIPNGTADVTFRVVSLNDLNGAGSGVEQTWNDIVGEPGLTLRKTSLTAGTLPATFDETTNTDSSWMQFRLDN